MTKSTNRLNFKIVFLSILLIGSVFILNDCKNQTSCALTKKIESIEHGKNSFWHSINLNFPALEPCIDCEDSDKYFYIQDFRQLEMVSKDFKKTITEEINLAHKFKDSIYYENGLIKYYQRVTLKDPIKAEINLDTLISILQIQNQSDLVFRSCKKRKAINGFLFDSKYARIVGITDNENNVKVLSLYNIGHESKEFLNRLQYLMKQYDLIYVNYIEEKVVSSEEIINYSGTY